MPASLATDWKCVATSGPTVDGRIIKPEWLTEMAETYDQEVYTALIWIDHNRYGNYGKVVALKSEEHGDKVKLFAKISPSRSLLSLNQVWEEKLFFSIEPMEDFAKSGKCYLVGLAMTDQPASLGTTETHFSQVTNRKFSARYPGEEVPDLRSMDEDQDEKKLFSLFCRLFRINQIPEEENDAMNKEELEQFNALKTEVTELKSVLGPLKDAVAKFSNQETPTPGKDNQEQPAEPTQTVDPKEFTELKDSVTGMVESFEQFTKKMESVVPPTTFEENPGGDSKKDQL